MNFQSHWEESIAAVVAFAILLGVPASSLAFEIGDARLVEIVMRVDGDKDIDTVIRTMPAMRVVERGAADATLARFLGLPVDTPIRQVLLAPTRAADPRQRLLIVGEATSDIALPRGVIALRHVLRDARRAYADLLANGEKPVAELQILRSDSAAPGYAFALAAVAVGAPRIEYFQPDARPMSAQELRRFTRGGRYSNWVRFNNQLTGNVHWRADGSARVRWDGGKLDEEGTWTLRGDAVCTAWKRLRNNQELCVQHYWLGGDRTQSFRRDGTPDGIHHWVPAPRDQ